MNETMQELMKAARKKAGLKQSEIAEKLGVKGGTVSNWELGKADPDIDSFVAFCRICEEDPIKLLAIAYGGTSEEMQEIECTAEEIEMIRKFRCLDNRGKRNVMRNLNAEYEDISRNSVEDLLIAAGFG